MDMFPSTSSKTLPFYSHKNTALYVHASDHGFKPYSGGVEDGEIGVFGAEKYFNGGMEEEESSSQRSTTTSSSTRKPPYDHSKQVEKLALAHHHQARPWLETPSAASESSSIISQRPLLKNIVRNKSTVDTVATVNNNLNSSKSNNFPENKNCFQETTSTKSFLSATLGYYCKCYSCKDKDCVDVGEISFSNTVAAKSKNNNNNNNKIIECVEDAAVSTGESFRDNHFSFHSFKQQEQEQEAERKSLEVFGSPVMGRLRNYKSMSLEKRLAMLSWNQTNNEDEVNSDCSSDLDKAVEVAEDNNNGGKTATGKSNYHHRRLKSESSVLMKKFEDGGFSFRSQGPPPPHRVLATRSLPRPYSPRLSNISFNIR
ncbi:protein PHYTOCHROME KINASE SUBSTRATE 1-like [Momordica charantia]|uniref:Protein PHYTOCHROME KINASE SUBSTRATE 1-like n=1 Tax=Momordica charantia TaxID=3673 RepID=A0A6J1CR71_MOMCH|nr:protein PHYTOCHROME KINASE SUBSTRATE 1-like [Momordica charantia]